MMNGFRAAHGLKTPSLICRPMLRPSGGVFLAIAATLAFSACAGTMKHADSTDRTAAPTAAPASSPAQTASTTPPQKTFGAGASAEYHFSLAEAYVSEGNPDKAIEEFKLVLMYDPNSSIVYAHLASEYVKKGMLSAAMETCKEALQRDPNFVDARLMLAGLYATSHESDSAVAEYDRILKVDPKHEEAAVYKAQVLIEDGRATDAVKVLQQFVKRDSESTLAWYYLGRAQEQAGDVKDAVKAYRKALALKPGFSQAGLALGYLYEEKKQNREAIEVYDGMFEEGQDLVAANRLATIYLKDEKYEKAIPYLEAIQAADPEDLNVRVKLGLVEMQLKHYERAIATFKAILEKNSDSDRIHYYLGSLYEETKKYDEAVAELKQIKPDSKLYSDAALHVAYLLKEGSKVEEAKTFMKGAIHQTPNNVSFYIFAASLDEESKDLVGAVHVLQEASAKFPEDEKVHYYLGSLFDRQGNSDKGIEEMESILKINPENVDALNYLGYTWTTKGVRLSDAEKMLRRALLLKPDNGYIQDSWGWYLFVRGRTQEAVVELEKAAKMKPNEPTILEHLGDAYLRSNLRQKALVRYKDAARYADDDDSRKKLESKVQNLMRELAQDTSVGMPNREPAEQR